LDRKVYADNDAFNAYSQRGAEQGEKMTRLTVEQDMKLGSALDQLEDAIEAAHAP
jgi:hypothetical protein